MATDKLLTGSVSFAHLHGISKPLGAKADDQEDDKKQMEGESDEDYAKRMDAEDGDPKDPDNDGDEDAEGDDADPEDEKKDAKSKASHARGVKSERARWAAVIGNKLFASNPALGARLLATTSLGAKAILGCLRDSPAAASAIAPASRAQNNPTVGSGAAPAPTGAAAIEQRWGAAFKRAGIVK